MIFYVHVQLVDIGCMVTFHCSINFSEFMHARIVSLSGLSSYKISIDHYTKRGGSVFLVKGKVNV